MKRDRYFFYACVWIIFLLPSACSKDGFFGDVDTDAPSVFEETWKVLDERYALFPEKAINWDSVRTVYQSRFTAGMPEQALFAELSRMLETLQDGHVALISPTDTSVYDGFYRGYPRNFNLDHVINNYLGGSFSQQGPFLYAIREQVGYVYYGQFSTELNDTDLRVLLQAMNGTRGLIVDVRDNTGGFVQVAERLASAFTTQTLLVKYEQFKSGTGRYQFTDPAPRNLVPGEDLYPHPVIVLTNRSCFSACNDFVLYTQSMPQVRRYGDQTGGGGSIPSSYRLANGWILQFSATRTLSAQMQSVEMGIQPDKKIEIGVLDDARGLDPILEAAFLDLR